MEITLANIILNANIVLGCISLGLNVFVLAVLISRERRFRKQIENHRGGHMRRWAD